MGRRRSIEVSYSLFFNDTAFSRRSREGSSDWLPSRIRCDHLCFDHILFNHLRIISDQLKKSEGGSRWGISSILPSFNCFFWIYQAETRRAPDSNQRD